MYCPNPQKKIATKAVKLGSGERKSACTAQISKEISNESGEIGQWGEESACTAQISKEISNKNGEIGQWREEMCMYCPNQQGNQQRKR